MKLALMASLVACLFTGCATLPPVNVVTPDDTEFQRKLDNDPRFQRLIDQLEVPGDDKWHLSTSFGSDQTRTKSGYFVEESAKHAW